MAANTLKRRTVSTEASVSLSKLQGGLQQLGEAGSDHREGGGGSSDCSHGLFVGEGEWSGSCNEE